jgi:hypothetical protein
MTLSEARAAAKKKTLPYIGFEDMVAYEAKQKQPFKRSRAMRFLSQGSSQA